MANNGVFHPSLLVGKEHSLECFQSIGAREEQEDSYVAIKLSQGYLYAVADGHFSSKVSDIVAANLQSAFLSAYDQEYRCAPYNLDPLQVVHSTFDYLQALVADEQCGSTLSLAFVEHGLVDGRGATRVTTGQMGDSFVAIKPRCTPLIDVTDSHNVRDAQADLDLINKWALDRYGADTIATAVSGYLCSQPRGSAIAITRSLGDRDFMLVREPAVKTHVYTSQEPLLLMIASDGVLSPTASRQAHIKSLITRYVAGETLVSIVRSINPEDNVTVIAVNIMGR